MICRTFGSVRRLFSSRFVFLALHSASDSSEALLSHSKRCSGAAEPKMARSIRTLNSWSTTERSVACSVGGLLKRSFRSLQQSESNLLMLLLLRTALQARSEATAYSTIRLRAAFLFASPAVNQETGCVLDASHRFGDGCATDACTCTTRLAQER